MADVPVKTLVPTSGWLHPAPAGADAKEGFSPLGMVKALIPIWPGKSEAVLLAKVLLGQYGRLLPQ